MNHLTTSMEQFLKEHMSAERGFFYLFGDVDDDSMVSFSEN